MTSEALSRLPELLLPWYREHKRDLPWRHTNNPYHIWLSEIMLQQTRVEAVRGYYARFLDTLPTIEALADCDDDTLHKLWEGLGYYSRVRNLKKAALAIRECHGGQFPRTYHEVLALPGIGEYTAGAICSIAFGLPTPAVDGNVLRVLSRLRDDPTPIDTPAAKRTAAALLAPVYPADAGDFTQSLMELGATVCGPNRNPDCGHCPLREICLGCQNGTAEALPVKSPKKEKRQEDRTVLILCCDGRYALRRRPGKGLLAGLWEFPNLPGHLTIPEALSAAEGMGLHPRGVEKEIHRSHIFTHIRWDMKGIWLEVAEPARDFQWFSAEEIHLQAALPTAFRQFWEETDHV